MAQEEPAVVIQSFKRRRNNFKTEALSRLEKGRHNIHSPKRQKILKNQAISLEQGTKKRKNFNNNNEALSDKLLGDPHILQSNKKQRKTSSSHMMDRDNSMKRILELEMSTKKKMEEMQTMLEEKLEEQQYLESIISSLTVKHFESNTELQNARRQLLKGLNDKLGARTKIGIRRMGALDVKAFQSACRERYSNDDADVKAAMLCSEWEKHLGDPNWHPFKIVKVDDKEVANQPPLQNRTRLFGEDKEQFFGREKLAEGSRGRS
ncbi:hypothetical protein KSP40_PGU017547 [Platanthera guangdongensis]|uniref:Factor of DNA methylation 1-5/IDN2 domain-containing protein n=1 Tax=Platanthera guangdongensis TaxID=2320717 RepID=A0ABR2LUT1_9ASPA